MLGVASPCRSGARSVRRLPAAGEAAFWELLDKRAHGAGPLGRPVDLVGEAIKSAISNRMRLAGVPRLSAPSPRPAGGGKEETRATASISFSTEAVISGG